MEIVNRRNGYFPGTFFKRSNRIQVVAKNVYFRNREGQPVGPFNSLKETEKNLNQYLDNICCDSAEIGSYKAG